MKHELDMPGPLNLAAQALEAAVAKYRAEYAKHHGAYPALWLRTMDGHIIVMGESLETLKDFLGD